MCDLILGFCLSVADVSELIFVLTEAFALWRAATTAPNVDYTGKMVSTTDPIRQFDHFFKIDYLPHLEYIS